MPSNGDDGQRRLLGVFAHPDDESCGPGGTLARYAAEGGRVAVICVTRGEWGGYGEQRKLPPWQMAALRAAELFAACRELGVRRCILLGHEDSSLEYIPTHNLVRELAELICDVNPHVIITHTREGPAGHSDHNVLSLIMPTAVEKALEGCHQLSLRPTVHRPNTYRLFEAVQSCCGLRVERNDRSVVVMDVRRYLRQKLAACTRHASQEYCWRPLFAGNYRRRVGREAFRLRWSREPEPVLVGGDLFGGLRIA